MACGTLSQQHVTLRTCHLLCLARPAVRRPPSRGVMTPHAPHTLAAARHTQDVTVSNTRLGLSEMMGVFVLLAGGVALAFLVASFENLTWCIRLKYPQVYGCGVLCGGMWCRVACACVRACLCARVVCACRARVRTPHSCVAHMHARTCTRKWT